MATDTQAEPWVDIRTAVEIGGPGVGRHHVFRWAREGLVAVRRLPGVRARYSRADLERLAREGEGGQGR